MKNNVVGYVPRLLYRIYEHLREKFDPKTPLRDEEILCIQITKKLILTQDSVLNLAPVSNKRFIKNESQQMFIMIDNRVINIVNHIYSYTIFIEDDKAYSEILEMFDGKLDSLRIALEEEFRMNVQNSLKKILDSIP